MPLSTNHSEPKPVDYDRQRERTVDNLKRLFALVFSLSFALAGANLFGLTSPFLTGQKRLDFSAPSLLITLEMFAVFAITAAVFYHQGAKFLDNKYAWPGEVAPHPFELAWDFFALVLQMVPFVFLASTLSPAILSTHGFTWFFFAYVITFLGGLILLVVGKILHWLKQNGSTVAERERNADVLRNYWVLMNSASLLILTLLFWWRITAGDLCPTNSALSGYTFLFLFGLIAFARDILDYAWAWPFVYPARPEERGRYLKWPMTAMFRNDLRIAGLNGWFLIGSALLVLV